MADERVEINQGGASMTTPILTDAAAAEIEQRESKARHALFEACNNKFQLRACIPAQPESDHDLLIAASLDDNVTLLADRRARIAELAAVTTERDAAKNMADVWRIRAEAHRQGADAAESALAARDAEVAALRGEIEHLKVVHVKPD